MITGNIIESCIDFTQRLIQTPSMSGEEQQIAQLVKEECESLGFDDVHIDDIGNVIARVYGQDRSLPALVVNTHLDHVDPGDPQHWESGAFEANIRNGRIYGRGAADIKGPVATQVYAIAALIQSGQRPKRDIVFTCVTEEEIGGTGAIYWAERVDYPIGLIVIGEPTSNQVALGHRGIRQVRVTFFGRSVHASVPHKADNPNYALGRFLTRLQERQHDLPTHPRLGATTVSPTIIDVDTTSRNVTPAWARVNLDFRSAAATHADLLNFIAELADGFSYDVFWMNGFDPIPLDPPDRLVTGFDTHPDDPVTQQVVSLLTKGMGRVPTIGQFAFATDGRHMTGLGAPIIGFAPGDEKEAHTANESIALDALAEGLRGYLAILRDY